jgi:ParB family chromosome partitioning protein
MAAVTENGNSSAKVAIIPIDKIRENQVALRDVNQESEKYLGLVDSIKEKGILNPILVREIRSPETGETLYGLIDGLHRWTAAKDAGLKNIPAQIRDMDQAEVEEAQIVANVHKIETKPVEYTKQLERLMARNPLMTVSELAKRLSKSNEWLYQRFNLLKLDEKVAALVDEGKIKLSNAYQLAKLPKEDQFHYVEKAMTMEPQQFTSTVTARNKEVREARRQGRAANPPQFEAVVHNRKWGEIKDEYNNKNVGPDLIKESGAKTAEEGWNLAIAWVVHMDPRSQKAQIEEHEAAKREKAEAKAKRDLERAEQRQREAQERAAKLQEEGVTT